MPHNKKIANVRKKDERREAQAALDYLMSWGWVLIIIVLVLVILFSLGVFKAPSAPTIISGFKRKRHCYHLDLQTKHSRRLDNW